MMVLTTPFSILHRHRAGTVLLVDGGLLGTVGVLNHFGPRAVRLRRCGGYGTVLLGVNDDGCAVRILGRHSGRTIRTSDRSCNRAVGIVYRLCGCAGGAGRTTGRTAGGAAALIGPLGIQRQISRDRGVEIIGGCQRHIGIPAVKPVARFCGRNGFHGCRTLFHNLAGHFAAAVAVKGDGIP